jgi:hypothetical protein
MINRILTLLLLLTLSITTYSQGGGTSQGAGTAASIYRSTFANLGTPVDGSVRYCTNCNVNTTPCTSGGTGAFATRVNGAWSCATASAVVGGITNSAPAGDIPLSDGTNLVASSVTEPSAGVVVMKEAGDTIAAALAPLPGLNIYRRNSSNKRLQMWGAGRAPGAYFYRTDGTIDAPTAVGDGFTLLELDAYAFAGGSSFPFAAGITLSSGQDYGAGTGLGVMDFNVNSQSGASGDMKLYPAAPDFASFPTVLDFPNGGIIGGQPNTPIDFRNYAAWPTYRARMFIPLRADGLTSVTEASPQSIGAGNLTSASTTATVVLTAHGFSTGQIIHIAAADQTEYNGWYVITVVDADTFTYTFAGSLTTPATGSITAARADAPIGPISAGAINYTSTLLFNTNKFTLDANGNGVFAGTATTTALRDGSNYQLKWDTDALGVFANDGTTYADIRAANFIMSNSSIRGDKTDGHSWTLEAWDVDAAASKPFMTCTNGNTPACALATPSGGLLTGNFSTLQQGGVTVATLSGSETLTNKLVQIPSTVVGSLGTCDAGATGQVKFVTDALLPVALATVGGGGAVKVPVVCTGSAWIVF